jgi:Amt family ammonium transporter
VAVINIDDFRVINDVLGYDVGDELLKGFSNFIRENIPDHIIIARLGSDEFGALFINCTERAVFSTCEHLRKRVADWRFIWKDAPFKVTISIGISSINKDSKSVSFILTSADFACNEAKKTGKNRIQIYHKNSATFMRRKEQLEMFLKLKNVIDQGDLFLLFQKIEPVNPADRYHFEALIRIKEDNQLVSPSAFLEVAENFQLVFDIDTWVVSSLFKFLHTLKNIIEIDFVVTINLSSKTVSDVHCFDVIKDLTEKYEIDTSTVGFEITETAAITNFDVATNLIEKLKGMGFTILLDDFGSGMSNFSRFQSLHVYIIKIDGSLIENVATNEFDKALVRGIVDIAKTIGAKTVAEFVHDKATYDTCKALGVDFLQGYYIQIPLPICSLFCTGTKVCLNGRGNLQPDSITDCSLYNKIIEMTKGDNHDKEAVPDTGS